MRNYKKLSNFVRKGTKLLLFVAMLMSLLTSAVTPAAALGPLVLTAYTLDQYDTTQGVCASATIEGTFNETLHLTGNCWMKLDLGTAYTVTANTILEFDFSSNAEGEIHGIGFDVDNTVDPSHLFQVYGTQVYATTQAFNNYSTSAPGTAHYIIPVGTFFTGAFQYLTFANDMDAAPQTAESIYTNIQVYEGTPPPPLMLTVNGANYPVESYDPAQDVGPSTVTVEDAGLTLHMVGNTWKRVGIPYNVTADTVVEFDFSSSMQGEIHGIGFDVDNTIDANTFQLYGTQVYGIQAFNNYSASAPSVVHYTIPVGTFFTGNFLHLTFANDQDMAAPTGESVFSNIVIHDNQATPTITFNQAPLAEYPGADFTVNAITDSDGALTYSYVSGPCVLVDAILGTFSPTGFGDCVVQANTAATALFLTGSAQQTVTITAPVVDLYAVSGTTALPGTSVTVWGYSITNSPVTQPGGPTLIVNQGDTVSINLHNELGVNTALLFQGQEMIPDMTGVAAGGTKNYTFTASRPGTYLYEAGLIPGAQYQTAMGLYGALIVRPATAGQAYDDATTAYDNQAVLVLSEIDPALNNSATPDTFDMRGFAAKYFLINGKAYPATDAIATLPGNNVLLRYVNASPLQHSMTTLGVDQQVIAYDGSPLQFSHRMVAETFGPGQTVDVIVNIPAGAAQGTKYAVYDGNLMLHNSGTAGFGGMLTFINVGTPPPPGSDELGPQATGMSVSPSPTDGSVDVTLTATVSDIATGGANVAAAEYYIDSTAGTPTAIPALDGNFDSSIEDVSATLSAASLGALSDGNHILYVRGQDSLNNWGPYNVIVLRLDKTGPVSKILYMTPNPTNGSVDVALAATGDDRLTGNGKIDAAEYFIGATGVDGTGTPMVMNIPNPPGAPIVSLNATISAPTTAGTYVVSVHSKDELGNWGAFATVDLVIDTTGPVTSNVQASPNPTNGVVGINSTIPAVRLTADLTETTSNIKAAEGFLDTIGADGTGFVMIPTDGLFNSHTESAYIDIPFSTIAQLPDGNYSLYVHGKDAAGNWGATSSTVLTINRTVPDLGNVEIVNNGAADAMLTANVTNAVGNIVLAEWFIGTDPELGNAARAQVVVNGTVAQLAASINVSNRPKGTYTVYLRAMDAAGNWSNLASTTLTVNNTTIIPPEPGGPNRIFIPMLTR